MLKYSRKYIGKTYETQEGYIAVVIDGSNNNGYCTIKVEDWITEVQVINLKTGQIKYPYHPSICGVGYLGVGSYKVTINRKKTKQYNVWFNMFQRCYNPKCQKKHPTYVGCTVSKEWHNFQVFAKWLDENYTDGFELDKDLLVKDNKIYSKEMCVFIPKRLNLFISNKQANNSSGYIGVCWNKIVNKWTSYINDCDTYKPVRLGLYDNKFEAARVYEVAREKMANRMKQKMLLEYSISDQRILDAIK